MVGAGRVTFSILSSPRILMRDGVMGRLDATEVLHVSPWLSVAMGSS